MLLSGSWRSGESDGGKGGDGNQSDRTLEQVVKTNKRNSVLGDLQNSAEQELEQPVLTSKLALLWAAGLNQRTLEVPSHLQYYVFHCHFCNLTLTFSAWWDVYLPHPKCADHTGYWAIVYCNCMTTIRAQKKQVNLGKRILFSFPETIFTRIENAPNCSLWVLPVWSAVCPATAEHRVPPQIQLGTLPVVPSAQQLLLGQMQLLCAGADSVHLPNYRVSEGLVLHAFTSSKTQTRFNLPVPNTPRPMHATKS